MEFGIYLDTGFATITITRSVVASSVKTSKTHWSATIQNLVPTARLAQYSFQTTIALGMSRRDVYALMYKLMHSRLNLDFCHNITYILMIINNYVKTADT